MLEWEGVADEELGLFESGGDGGGWRVLKETDTDRGEGDRVKL